MPLPNYEEEIGQLQEQLETSKLVSRPLQPKVYRGSPSGYQAGAHHKQLGKKNLIIPIQSTYTIRSLVN